MSYLGLDFGEKRVGMAKSDELNFMAHPMGFIPRKNDEQVAQAVNELVDEHHIEKIVVGLPTTMKGDTGAQAKLVLSFVQILKRVISCAVVTWDERLTTAQAEKMLLAQDVSRAKRRLKRDAIAAEIMLQSYLDYLKEQRGPSS